MNEAYFFPSGKGTSSILFLTDILSRFIHALFTLKGTVGYRPRAASFNLLIKQKRNFKYRYTASSPEYVFFCVLHQFPQRYLSF